MENYDFFTNLLKEQKLIKSQIDALNSALAAIEQLIPLYDSAPQNHLNVHKTVSDAKKAYKVGDRVTDKVIESLTTLTSATANDVGDKLVDLYPEQFDTRKARSAAKVTLSRLNKENKVTIMKIEGKNQFIYSLIKENPTVDDQSDFVV